MKTMSVIERGGEGVKEEALMCTCELKGQGGQGSRVSVSLLPREAIYAVIEY